MAVKKPLLWSACNYSVLARRCADQFFKIIAKFGGYMSIIDLRTRPITVIIPSSFGAGISLYDAG